MRSRINLFVPLAFLAGVIFFGGSSPAPLTHATANAGGVAVADDDTEVLYTCSADGKTVYMWQCFGGKVPIFLGRAEAIESR